MQPTKAKFLAFRVYRSRDGEAYRALYKEYREGIRRYLALKLPNTEVDEAVSEVMLRGWEYMTANMVEHPRALFHKIAQNVIAAFYQQRERRPQEALTQEVVEGIPTEGSFVDQLVADEGLKELLRKINTLKDEYRDALLLKYVHELSVEEIALKLEKTPNNIRVILFRAREAIKKLL